jgi:phage-related minor tail protein
MPKKNNAKRGKKDITLRDVVVHIGHMEQRLSSRMTGVETEMKDVKMEMKSMEKRLSSRMDGMETRLTERIDALDEDLTATMHDTMRIRAHVGMPVPTE